MTRPMPAPLLAALEGSPVAGYCLVLRARDGAVIGLTTLDEPQVVDLSDDDGPADVTCDASVVISSLTFAVGFDASFCEASGPLGEVADGAGGLTRAQVDGGRWDDAEAWLVEVSPGVAGFAPMLAGKVREPRTEDPRFVLEIRGAADDLNQSLTREVNPYCPLRFGAETAQGICPAVPVELAATITAVTDSMRFAVSYAGAERATGFFNFGELAFTDGVLDGVTADLITAWTSGGAGVATIELWEPLWGEPEVGDSLTLRQGCYDPASNTTRTRETCMALLGSAIDFGGEPDVPGRDVLLYPDGTA